MQMSAGLEKKVIMEENMTHLTIYFFAAGFYSSHKRSHDGGNFRCWVQSHLLSLEPVKPSQLQKLLWLALQPFDGCRDRQNDVRQSYPLAAGFNAKLQLRKNKPSLRPRRGNLTATLLQAALLRGSHLVAFSYRLFLSCEKHTYTHPSLKASAGLRRARTPHVCKNSASTLAEAPARA